MAVPIQTIIDWLTGLGWNALDPGQDAAGVPFRQGPYIYQEPDRIVTITKSGGPGIALEGAADIGQFQARVRGMQSPNYGVSYTDAETLAFTLDQLIFNAQFPVVVNDQVMVLCVRTGGEPAPLTSTPDDGDRFEFVCNYLLMTSMPGMV